MSARVAPTSEYRAQARGKSTLDAVDMWRELLQQAPVSERRKSAVTKAIDMHRVILAAKSKQGLPKGRAQRSMAIKSTSQRRTLLEEPVEASLAMRCCCRRPKRRPHADALAAHKPTTVDDDMPFSTPEEEAPRCLPISPLSPWKLSWDLFQLALLLTVAFTLPLRLAFDIQSLPLAVWDTLVDVCLMLDVVVNFFVSYYDSKGILVTKFRSIALQYLRTFFAVDVVSSMPEIVFDSSIGLAKALKAGRLVKPLRLFRLTRMFKLIRAKSFLSRVDQSMTVNRTIIRFAGSIVSTFYFSHIAACIFIAMGNSWSAGTITWMDRFHVRDESYITQYNIALYYVITTLCSVGYGDYTPVTNEERSFAMFLMLSGGVFFGYIVAVVGAMVMSANKQENMIAEQVDDMTRYMQAKSFPEELIVRVRRYFRNYYSVRTIFSERDMLGKMPDALRQEVLMSSVDPVLRRQISFSLLSVEIIAQLQLDMVPLSVLPGDLILECGDPSLEVYFVCSGELELLTPDLFPVAKLFRHASFGEPEVLHGTVRQVSVRAVQDSFLFAMSGETLIATLNKFTALATYCASIIMALRTQTRKVEHHPVVLKDVARLSELFSAKPPMPRLGFQDTVVREIHELRAVVGLLVSQLPKATGRTPSTLPVSASFYGLTSVYGSSNNLRPYAEPPLVASPAKSVTLAEAAAAAVASMEAESTSGPGKGAPQSGEFSTIVEHLTPAPPSPGSSTDGDVDLVHETGLVDSDSDPGVATTTLKVEDRLGEGRGSIRLEPVPPSSPTVPSVAVSAAGKLPSSSSWAHASTSGSSPSVAAAGARSVSGSGTGFRQPSTGVAASGSSDGPTVSTGRRPRGLTQRSVSCEPAVPVVSVRLKSTSPTMEGRAEGHKPPTRRSSMVSESMDEHDYHNAERQAQRMVEESGPKEVMEAFVDFLLSAYSRKVCVISGRRAPD